MSRNKKNKFSDLEKTLYEIRQRIRKSFVSGVYHIHAGIVTKFYTASSNSLIGLRRRTGKAAKSWKVSKKEDNNSISCSVYSAGAPYAGAFMKGMFIRPKKKKWLAIPVGAALTSAGAPRYPNGPREAEQSLSLPPSKGGGFRRRKAGARSPISFYKKDERTAFLFAKDGVKGTGLTKNKRLLFVLKKVVKRQGKTSTMFPWIDNKMTVLTSRLTKASGSSFSI